MSGIQIPDRPVLMTTNRDFRLSSLNGYVVNFRADEPALVPPQCFEEAVGIGAVLCEEQPEVEEKEKGAQPSVREAHELEAAGKAEYVKKAVLELMAENELTKFRADGYPKAKAVIEILAPECPTPTATEIQEIFDELRENVDLIED